MSGSGGSSGGRGIPGKKRGEKKTSGKKKKTEKKRSKRDGRRKKGKTGRTFGRWVLFVILLICVAGGFLWYQHKPPKVHKPVIHKNVKVEKKKKPKKIIEEKKEPVAIPAPVVKIPQGPKVAIIVDDLGASIRVVKTLLAIPAPINFAILPHLSHSKKISKMASSSGKIVLLHLPMEPLSKNANPGPGSLLVNMNKSKLTKTITADLESVPDAIGVNNHMGSKFSADKNGMKIVVNLLKNKNLFFIDSRTSAKTVAYKTALEKGMRTGQRDIFLDNKRTEKAIAEQMTRLEKIARKKGSAIAICHPYKETLTILNQKVQAMQKRGIVFVPVTDLLSEGRIN